MPRCAQCALEVEGPGDLCAHHHYVYDADWAAGNRIMCDFLHRGKVPARPDVAAIDLAEIDLPLAALAD